MAAGLSCALAGLAAPRRGFESRALRACNCNMRHGPGARVAAPSATRAPESVVETTTEGSRPDQVSARRARGRCSAATTGLRHSFDPAFGAPRRVLILTPTASKGPSPLGPPWESVLRHVAKRIQWADPRIAVDVFADDSLTAGDAKVIDTCISRH